MCFFITEKYKLSEEKSAVLAAVRAFNDKVNEFGSLDYETGLKYIQTLQKYYSINEYDKRRGAGLSKAQVPIVPPTADQLDRSKKIKRRF